MKLSQKIFLLISVSISIVASVSTGSPDAGYICHYSCQSCNSPLETGCTECSDSSRGYNGVPGYSNTCYCVSEGYQESFQSECDNFNAMTKIVETVVSIQLWIIFGFALFVTSLGNQFMGLYCIESIQLMGYFFYSSHLFPESIQIPLSYSRQYSLNAFGNLLHASFIQDYQISSSKIVPYVLIDQQLLPQPKFVYIDLPSNFIYNALSSLIALGVLGAFLCLMHFLAKPLNNKIITKLYESRQSIILRILVFLGSDLLLFSLLQFTDAKFKTILSSCGLILAFLVLLLFLAVFIYILYKVNILEINFHDPQNQAFFNRLLKDDKYNRNFLLLQLLNKVCMSFTLAIALDSPTLQLVSLSLLQIFFSLFTINHIKLKKNRDQIFLLTTNLAKIIISFIFLLFALFDSKLIFGQIFSVVYIFCLSNMLIYLLIDIVSKFPDFLRESKHVLQMHQSAFNSNPNTINLLFDGKSSCKNIPLTLYIFDPEESGY